jgi:predicted nucleic acid-binding Zn ribbon protein
MMENLKNCPYCGKEILKVAKKCKYCGEWLDGSHPNKEQINCPICGERIDADTEVCPHCNENIVAYQRKTSIQDSQDSILDENTEKGKISNLNNDSSVGVDKPIKKNFKIIFYLISIFLFVLFAIGRIIFGFHYYNDLFESYEYNGIYISELVVDTIFIGAPLIFILLFYFSIRKKCKCQGVVSNNKQIKIDENVIKPRKHNNKRKITIYAIIALIIFSTVGIVIIEKNKKEARIQEFVNNATNFKLNASIISIMSRIILEDYHNNWASAINDNTAINARGNKVYCSDFNHAINIRNEFYSKLGCMETLDSLNNEMSSEYQKMQQIDDVPEKYSTLLTSYDDIRKFVSIAIQQCKTPSGNLIEFSKTINDIYINLDNSIKQTNVMIGDQTDCANGFINTNYLSILVSALNSYEKDEE